MNYHLIIIGSLAAIIYSYLFLPKHEGGTAGSDSFTVYPFVYKGNIKIPVSRKKILHLFILCNFFAVRVDLINLNCFSKL